MNKIVISGYYGFANAGDEAMLTSIVRALRGVSRKLSDGYFRQSCRKHLPNISKKHLPVLTF